MLRARSLRYHAEILMMFLLVLLLNACERHSYNLLDPNSAGKMTLYTTSDGLPSNVAGDIKLDSKGNLWFTFPGYGMAKLNDNGWTTYTSGLTPLLSNAVTVLAETVSGSMIVGTSNGLSILSGSNAWSSFTDPSVSMYVTAIKVASNGWIWVGTQGHGIYLNTGTGFTRNLTAQNSKINAIEEGEPGTLFFGTDSGLIKFNGSAWSYIKVSDGLPAGKVTSIRHDSRQRLWIGTRGGATAAWLDKDGIHKLDLMAGADSLNIKDILEDRKGNIWFATSGNGLIRFNGIVPYSFKEYNGFPENRINCMCEDKYGNLWFGLASKGVVKYTLPLENK